MSARGENSAVASSFLTPAEQRTVFEAEQKEGRSDRLFLWGGYPGAERRAAIFLPTWMTSDERPPQGVFSSEREEYYLRLLSSFGAEDLPAEFISTLVLRGSGYAELSHRDWLGALMALGIKRSVLGDIVSDGETFRTFAEKSCAAFLISELRWAGRDAVSCTAADAGEKFVPKREFKEISFTVSSPRADAVIRTLCALSREKAAAIIEEGSAELNYYPLTQPDKKLSAGDILSVRGFGKFIIDRAQDETRKGRIRVAVRKYT